MSFFDLRFLEGGSAPDAAQPIAGPMADEASLVPQIVPATSATAATRLQRRSIGADVAAALRSDAENLDLWRDLYEERAAIREFDGGFTRREAERRALEDVVPHWLAKHPLPATSRAVGCAQCGLPDPDTPLLARDGHTWVHMACWSRLMARRASEALAALIRVLNLPEDFDARQDSSTIPDPAGEGEG